LAVETGEAVELHDRAARPEEVALAAPPREVEIDRGRIEDRRRHLPGHEAEPDQLVEAELVAVQEALDRGGVTHDLGGADRLVGVLRALLLLAAPETDTAGRDVALAELVRDPVAGRAGGRGGDAGRVGSHV